MPGRATFVAVTTLFFACGFINSLIVPLSVNGRAFSR